MHTSQGPTPQPSRRLIRQRHITETFKILGAEYPFDAPLYAKQMSNYRSLSRGEKVIYKRRLLQWAHRERPLLKDFPLPIRGHF